MNTEEPCEDFMDTVDWRPYSGDIREGATLFPVAHGFATVQQFRNGELVRLKAEVVMLNTGEKFLTTQGAKALSTK